MLRSHDVVRTKPLMPDATHKRSKARNESMDIFTLCRKTGSRTGDLYYNRRTTTIMNAARERGQAGEYDAERTRREETVGEVINDKGQMLLVDGTLVETKRKTWMTAARQGDSALLLEYIEELRDVPGKDGVRRGINFKEPNGYTPLAVAATYNQLDTVNLLIEMDADVNEPNNWKDTAMHRAADAGYHEMVQLLLDARADPMAEDWVLIPCCRRALPSGPFARMHIYDPRRCLFDPPRVPSCAAGQKGHRLR